MSIRSRGLLAMSVALMASAGALAYVLEHDAVGTPVALDKARPGEDLTVKGVLGSFVPRPTTAHEAARWTEVTQVLDNFTYTLDQGGPGDMVLVTSPTAGPSPGTTVVTTGEVVLRTTHPDRSGRMLVVLLAEDLESPILFR